MITRFRTGAITDETPPNAPGARDVTFTEQRGFLGMGVAGCGESVGFQLTVDAAQDDNAPEADLLYNVYAGPSADRIDFSRVRVALRSGRQWLGRHTCNPTFDFSDGTRVIALKAVDRAGNESEASAPIAMSTCGCSGTSGGALTALLALASCVVRRRRR